MEEIAARINGELGSTRKGRVFRNSERGSSTRGKRTWWWQRKNRRGGIELILRKEGNRHLASRKLKGGGICGNSRGEMKTGGQPVDFLWIERREHDMLR